MVVCYSKKKWPGDPHPNSWAILERGEICPAARRCRLYAAGTVEAASRPTGSPQKDFYPLDVERGLPPGLDRIKAHVKLVGRTFP